MDSFRDRYSELIQRMLQRLVSDCLNTARAELNSWRMKQIIAGKFSVSESFSTHTHFQFSEVILIESMIKFFGLWHSSVVECWGHNCENLDSHPGHGPGCCSEYKHLTLFLAKNTCKDKPHYEAAH